MAKQSGLQQREKRPMHVIPRKVEQQKKEDVVKKVTFALTERHLEMLDDFVYHAKKKGLKTNKSEVVRYFIELLPSLIEESGNYRNMEDLTQNIIRALATSAGGDLPQ